MFCLIRPCFAGVRSIAENCLGNLIIDLFAWRMTFPGKFTLGYQFNR